MKIINSKIFGLVDKLEDKGREAFELVITMFPVDAFQVLNKILNKKGLMISITTILDEESLKEML